MNILLIEDHLLFRDGLKLLLSGLDSDLEFIEADDIAQAKMAVGNTDVDVVLLDLHLPDADGLEGLSRVREFLPDATIVVLSSEDDPKIIRGTIDQGAAGFIPKSSSKKVLITALNLILAGGSYIPPHALDKLWQPARKKPPQGKNSLLQLLTARQRSVLDLAMQGKVNKSIAREMNISEATVKYHLSACFRALGVKNRTEALFAATHEE